MKQSTKKDEVLSLKYIINNMELINRNDVSLGLAPFDILGFKSEEELNLEISKLIKARSEFDTKNKVTSN